MRQLRCNVSHHTLQKMEQHPVPRNISSFQFHLIGDMTVRQFGYLAVAAFLAYIVYRLSPFPGVVSIILAGMVALIGVAFAFVPIQERPLDKWIVAFIKSVFSPTQYVWQKAPEIPEIFSYATHVQQSQKGSQVDAHLDAKQKLQAYVSSLPSQPHQNLNKNEKLYIDATLALFNSTYGYTMPASPIPQTTTGTSPLTAPVRTAGTAQPASVQTTPPPIPQQTIPATPKLIQVQPKITPIDTQNYTVPTPPPQSVASIMADTAQPASLAAAMEATPSQPPTIPEPSPTPPHNKEEVSSPPPEHQPQQGNNLQNQLEELAKQKELLAHELELLKNELKKVQKPEVVKPEVGEETPVKRPTIKAFSSAAALEEIGMPKLPQTPNIVVGIVKDGQKRILPNIIVTIKDSKNQPIRALKTNKLGQFMIATPLANGVYFLEFEDPLKRYAFDIAEITLNGKIFLPIEIIAKGEKELLREQLSKELFGNGTI